MKTFVKTPFPSGSDVVHKTYVDCNEEGTIAALLFLVLAQLLARPSISTFLIIIAFTFVSFIMNTHECNPTFCVHHL